MRAIKLEDDEMARMARDESLEVMKPEPDRPRVYYRNLWRYSKSFIGGSVATEADGVVDCVEGAHVRLTRTADHRASHHRQLRRLQVRQARRKLRHLRCGDPAKGDEKTVEAKLGVSINLGEIRV